MKNQPDPSVCPIKSEWSVKIYDYHIALIFADHITRDANVHDVAPVKTETWSSNILPCMSRCNIDLGDRVAHIWHVSLSNSSQISCFPAYFVAIVS